MSISANNLLLGAAAIGLLAWNSLFVVGEGQQAIITQFGRPVGEPIQSAGLRFKLPFIQDVRYVERRLLNWSGKSNQIPTKDKKYIFVDTTARYRVEDPLLFIQTVQNEERARSRIDTIIESTTRDIISSHNLVEAVRNTNAIIEQRKTVLRNVAESIAVSPEMMKELEEEDQTELERISVGREQLSGKIFTKAKEELKKLGIDLIDVQLRRISYEDSVEAKVYERMISERKKIAAKIRSFGKGEEAKIRGRTSEELQQIESESFKKVKEIKGGAEAEVIRIYADAVGNQKDLYEFLRTLEVYRTGIRDETRYVLSADSGLFRLLSSGKESQ